MRIQQLQYIIKIVETGSMNEAAKQLFITQPSLSNAVKDLENEMGIEIFIRNPKGITLTRDGMEFLSYARQVVEQIDLLSERYKNPVGSRELFSVSSQHYAFVVNAFVALVKEYGENKYEFSLRESRTFDIIEDVRTKRSELGIIFLSHFNREVIQRILQNDEMQFVPLFTAKPHVFVSRNNPLATRKKVMLEDLKEFPRLTYEQGINNSFYFSEELHSTIESPKNIIVSDRATLFNLLIGLNGYTISSGILSSDLNGTEIVSIPLQSDEMMEIGYIHPTDHPLSEMSERYLEHLRLYIVHYQSLV